MQHPRVPLHRNLARSSKNRRIDVLYCMAGRKRPLLAGHRPDLKGMPSNMPPDDDDLALTDRSKLTDVRIDSAHPGRKTHRSHVAQKSNRDLVLGSNVFGVS